MDSFITNGDWDYQNNGFWVGGYWSVPNMSAGYHGILKQWWDFYDILNPNVLLVSENNKVKNHFNKIYPTWNITTLDFFDNMGEEIDLKADLCLPWTNFHNYDKIICQATFEHLFDPCMALRNLKNSLNPNGEIYLHTHTPEFEYHQYPRDYIRFFPDWFIDAGNIIGGIVLKELFMRDGHIFVLYKNQER